MTLELRPTAAVSGANADRGGSASTIHGQPGVLRTTPDAVQCHQYGEWYRNLAAHAWAAHGLNATEYRRTYGPMRKTTLPAPNLRAEQSRRARDHLIEVGEPHSVNVQYFWTLTVELPHGNSCRDSQGDAQRH